MPFPRKIRKQTAKTSFSQVIKENLCNPVLSKTQNSTNQDGLFQCLENDKEKSKPAGLKRKANSEVNDIRVTRKRAAFGDITNAVEKSFNKNGKSEAQKPLNANLPGSLSQPSTNADVSSNLSKENSQPSVSKCKRKPANQHDSLDESIIVLSQKLKLDVTSSSYITASEGSPIVNEDSIMTKPDIATEASHRVPPDVEDFDKASSGDVHTVSSYAKDIFDYYKIREVQFPVSKYISQQPDISRSMRAILVDWMVEVQESFELNHESLYLAVKLVDLYLSKKVIKRDRLQLVGSTAIFIACKFDERTPPFVDDFLYICDDTYKRKEIVQMEIHILKTLGYDLGIPLSYRFLRRYSRCAKIGLETLTFARYILELTLMEYEFVESSASLLSAATLFLAIKVKKIADWSPTLVYYSGYTVNDISSLVHSLHQMILQPPKEHLETIRKKYSHKIFFEAAKTPIPRHLDV